MRVLGYAGVETICYCNVNRCWRRWHKICDKASDFRFKGVYVKYNNNGYDRLHSVKFLTPLSEILLLK